MCGVMEIWDLKKKLLVGTIDAGTTSYIDWSPCGRYLVTATLSPRLRVENGFKVWNYHGDLIASVSYKELYAIGWNTTMVASFVPLQSKGVKPSVPQKVAAYVPPSLRNASPQTKSPSAPSRKPASITKTLQKSPASMPDQESDGSKSLSPLEKEILNLSKKLKQIALLKSKPESLLQDNQKEKIAKEKEFLDRMGHLIKQRESA